MQPAEIKAEDPLITLEVRQGDHGVPAPVAGTVGEVKVKVGDRVSEGSLILTLRRRAGAEAAGQLADAAAGARRPPPAAGRRAIACRGAGAGRRPGRLHRRLPRRRSRQEGGAGRALADARRRVSQRRLHPVQGAAARGQGDRRGRRRFARTGSRSARPTIDLDKLRGWKDGVVKRLTGGLAALARQRKVDGGARRRPVRLAQPRRGRDGRRRREDRQLRAGDHRRRLGAGDAARSSRRRSARDRLDRRARDRRHAQAPAGARRRHHRARDGDRLSRARREDHRRRDDGPADPRRRPRHRRAAGQADRQALRERSCSRPR